MIINRKESGFRNVPELHIKQEFLILIKSGLKTIDVEQEGPKTTNIQVGGKLIFKSSQESVMVKILAIRKYPSIEEILKSEPLESMLPGKSIQEAEQIANKLFIKGKPLLAIEIKMEKQ